MDTEEYRRQERESARKAGEMVRAFSQAMPDTHDVDALVERGQHAPECGCDSCDVIAQLADLARKATPQEGEYGADVQDAIDTLLVFLAPHLTTEIGYALNAILDALDTANRERECPHGYTIGTAECDALRCSHDWMIACTKKAHAARKETR